MKGALQVIESLIEFLSNSNLSFFENFIIWVNVFSASFAAYSSTIAAKRGILGMRNTFKLVSGLAWLYVVSYLFLLLSDVNFLQWSSIMRGVSILVWFIVWSMPAIISVKLWTKLEHTVKKGIKKEERDEGEE